LTLGVKRIYKYFNPETTWYQRSDRKQYNKRVVSATKDLSDISCFASRIRRRVEIKTSRPFEPNTNDECQRQLHVVEETKI
ncbi:hypothetical protein T4D_5893, partial [Trichinella pseudospiralis]